MIEQIEMQEPGKVVFQIISELESTQEKKTNFLLSEFPRLVNSVSKSFLHQAKESELNLDLVNAGLGYLYLFNAGYIQMDVDSFFKYLDRSHLRLTESGSNNDPELCVAAGLYLCERYKILGTNQRWEKYQITISIFNLIHTIQKFETTDPNIFFGYSLLLCRFLKILKIKSYLLEEMTRHYNAALTVRLSFNKQEIQIAKRMKRILYFNKVKNLEIIYNDYLTNLDIQQAPNNIKSILKETRSVFLHASTRGGKAFRSYLDSLGYQ